jgi:hypothetical protein
MKIININMKQLLTDFPSLLIDLYLKEKNYLKLKRKKFNKYLKINILVSF